MSPHAHAVAELREDHGGEGLPRHVDAGHQADVKPVQLSRSCAVAALPLRHAPLCSV
jgi:hypothetical protein